MPYGPSANPDKFSPPGPWGAATPETQQIGVDLNAVYVSFIGSATQVYSVSVANTSIFPSFIASTTVMRTPGLDGYGAQITFDSSTTWLCPAGYTYILAESWGGGGGGGSTGSNQGCGGGGGGAYAKRLIPVTPGNTYTVTVGVGGSPQVSPSFGPAGPAATSGGTSTFTGDSSTSSSAVGGGGANQTTAGSGGLASSSTGDVKFSGGNGGTGVANSATGGAGGGEGAGTTADGHNGTNSIAIDGSGKAGGTGGDGGDGGSGGTYSFGNGNAGSITGGGGGGTGGFGTNGGTGARGQVRLTLTPTLLPSFIASTTVVRKPQLDGLHAFITYTSTDSWICPSGVVYIQVEAWGGGGGGNATVGGLGRSCGGGGGGAYSGTLQIPVTPGNTYTLTIGLGGGVSTNGGDSSFVGDASATVLAKGGIGASGSVVNGASGGAAASGTGVTKRSGGRGGDGRNDGSFQGGGGGGEAAAANADGNPGGTALGPNNPNGGAGGSGAGEGGDGGLGGTYAGGPATGPGQVPGGGGGGAPSFNQNNTAREGADGQIRIQTMPPVSVGFISSHTQIFEIAYNAYLPFISSVTFVKTATISRRHQRSQSTFGAKLGLNHLAEFKLADWPSKPPTLSVSFSFISTSTVVYDIQPFFRDLSIPFIPSTSFVYDLLYQVSLFPSFIPSTTAVYTPVVQAPTIDIPFIGSVSSVYTIYIQSLAPSFIPSATTVYTASIQGDYVAPPFVASSTTLYAPTLQHNYIDIPFITSTTVLYLPYVQPDYIDIPFIAAANTIFDPYLQHDYIDVPFIESRTSIKPITSVWRDSTGRGNGGETFGLELAPNGVTITATVSADFTATDTNIHLTGYSSLPSVNGFCLSIDSEVMYVIPTSTPGLYRATKRGFSNTTPASHSSGASARWTDTYDMAVESLNQIGHTVVINFVTYDAWLIAFDSTQAYQGTARYSTFVSELVGVFPPGTGHAGTNRTDSSQPSAEHAPAGLTDNCPVGITVPARMTSDIEVGDVVLLRYVNTSATPLLLGPRAAMVQSWYGFMRVDVSNHDVTSTDTGGTVVDASVNGEFHNQSYTTVAMPGSMRTYTYGPPRYSDKGWPIAALAVRQGTKRIPLWSSPDWHDFTYVFTGFGPDDTFVQVLINRNGFNSANPEPSINLPGSQTITGPNATWDDSNNYYMSVAWYVGIFKATAQVIAVGPPVNPGPYPPPQSPPVSPPPIIVVPPGPGGGGTYIPPPPPSPEGGSGGNIPPPPPLIEPPVEVPGGTSGGGNVLWKVIFGTGITTTPEDDYDQTVRVDTIAGIGWSTTSDPPDEPEPDSPPENILMNVKWGDGFTVTQSTDYDRTLRVDANPAGIEWTST